MQNPKIVFSLVLLNDCRNTRIAEIFFQVHHIDPIVRTSETARRFTHSSGWKIYVNSQYPGIDFQDREIQLPIVSPSGSPILFPRSFVTLADSDNSLWKHLGDAISALKAWGESLVVPPPISQSSEDGGLSSLVTDSLPPTEEEEDDLPSPPHVEVFQPLRIIIL